MTGKVKFVQQKGGLLPEYRDNEPSTPNRNAGSSSSSIPLTDTQPYTDFPVESLEALPAYTDSPLPVLYPASSLAHDPSIAAIPDSVLTSDEITTITHHTPFSSDPQALHDFLLQQNEIPPKPVIRLLGTHHESRRKSDGKTERVTITDFDIKLDLSPYIARSLNFQPGTPNSGPDTTDWKFLTVVENDTKTFRGTRTKRVDKAFKASLETYVAPHLGDWTKTYCEDPHPVKSFTFKKAVTAMDHEHLTALLRSLVEQTHYLGHLQIKHYTTHSRISIYSPHWINRWRVTRWIRWLFYLSFLWIFAWPTIWFMERRYEVVTSVWPYSLLDCATGAKRYAVASEEAWFLRYRNAIRQAVLARRQGVVGEADVMACNGTDDDGAIRIGDGSGFGPGGLAIAIGAVGGGGGGVLGMTRGLLGAGVVGASRGLDAIRGWGGDT